VPRSRLVVLGTICTTRTVNIGGSGSLLAVLDDQSGQIGLLFLGRPLIGGLIPNARCSVEGTVRQGRTGLVILNPLYRLEP
jgi:hypothetical protein